MGEPRREVHRLLFVVRRYKAVTQEIFVIRTYDVKLPITQRAVFPSTCVICGADHPDSWIKLSDDAAGLLTMLIWRWFATKVRVEAPACANCAKAYRWKQIKNGIFLTAWLVIGVVIAIESVPTNWSKLAKEAALLGALALSVLIYVVWTTLDPLPFEILADDTDVSYQFTNAEFAFGFAILNNAQVE